MGNTKEEIQKIKERNKRVEADKAWETSIARRAMITVATYFIVVVFLYSIEAPRPWLNALVPTMGYVISTLSLPFVKRFWMKNIYRK